MANGTEFQSILAQHVAERGRHGTPAGEVAAIAFDSSAMLSRVVSILELMAAVPAVAQSEQGRQILELMAPLKARRDAHVDAMERLARGGSEGG